MHISLNIHVSNVKSCEYSNVNGYEEFGAGIDFFKWVRFRKGI